MNDSFWWLAPLAAGGLIGQGLYNGNVALVCFGAALFLLDLIVTTKSG